jgi:hypothetical protein
MSGGKVSFQDVWNRRRTLDLAPGVNVVLPALDDLILTKKFGAGPKDLEDIRLLQVLRSEEVKERGEG